MVFSSILSFISWTIKAQGSISLNSSIDKGFVVSIFDSVANILNLAMCSLIKSVFFFLRLYNASLTESNIENASMSSFLNIVYVPNLSFGLAGTGLL
jgi:hypothetical protein